MTRSRELAWLVAFVFALLAFLYLALLRDARPVAAAACALTVLEVASRQ